MRICDIERRLKSLEKKEVAGACVACDGRGSVLDGYCGSIPVHSDCFSCRRRRGWGLPTKKLRDLRETLQSTLSWLRHRQEHSAQVRKAERELAKLTRRLEKL